MFRFAEYNFKHKIMIKKEVESQNFIEDVYFDIEGVIEIMQKRGVSKNIETIAKEMGYTTMGLRKIRSKAPKAVSVLHNFLKENCLKFEDLVKECKSKK